jgi:hypothetical protein
MRKKVVLALITTGFYALASSQPLMKGVGLNWMVQPMAATGLENVIRSLGITYNSRFNLVEYKNSSFSFGTPVTLGISGYDGAFPLLLDVPIIINYNLGIGSLSSSISRYGYFVGGGFAYHGNLFWKHGFPGGNPFSSASRLNLYSISDFGPVINAGIRLRVGYGMKNIELRISYMRSTIHPWSNYTPTGVEVYNTGHIYAFGCFLNL